MLKKIGVEYHFPLSISLDSSHLLLSSFLRQIAFVFDGSHLSVSKAHFNPCYYHKTMWKHWRWRKRANLWLLLAMSPHLGQLSVCRGMVCAYPSLLSYPPKQ